MVYKVLVTNACIYNIEDGGITKLDKLNDMEDYTFIFGTLFVVANKMDTLLEKELKEYDVTSKQWLLSAVLDSLFDYPPTIKEAAREMGSSHQNVKQLALKLEQKGLLALEKDKKDARATRLRLTEDSFSLWSDAESKGITFIQNIFKGIDKEEISKVRKVFEKIQFNLDQLEKADID